MRETTKNKASLAAIWTAAGVPRDEIAALLHVSPLRVRRLLTTTAAREIRAEIINELAAAAVQIRVKRFNEKFPPKSPPPSLFLKRTQAFFDEHFAKYGGRR